MNSYDYQNQIRSLDEVFQTLIAKAPFLLSLIKIGAPATNTKHEWMEDSLTPTSTGITSFATDGDGTVINVASSAGLRIGSILRVVTSAGASKGDLMKVGTVNSTTQITVVRGYGSTTPATLLTTDVLHLVSSPLNEKSTGTAQPTSEPTMPYNHMQILICICGRCAHKRRKTRTFSLRLWAHLPQMQIKIKENSMKVKRLGSKRRIQQAVSDDVVRGVIKYVYSQPFLSRLRFCWSVLRKKRKVKIGK